jgi:hypothetical protein
VRNDHWLKVVGAILAMGGFCWTLAGAVALADSELPRAVPLAGIPAIVAGLVMLAIYASREPGQRWHNGRWVTATGEVTDVDWALDAGGLPAMTLRLQCAEHGTFTARAFFPGIAGRDGQVQPGARVMVRVRDNDRTRIEVVSVDGRAMAERMQRIVRG